MYTVRTFLRKTFGLLRTKKSYNDPISFPDISAHRQHVPFAGETAVVSQQCSIPGPRPDFGANHAADLFGRGAELDHQERNAVVRYEVKREKDNAPQNGCVERCLFHSLDSYIVM